MNRTVEEAALDVAIERLTTFHPGNQIFIFGAEGKPFWARFKPDAYELDVLKLATSALEDRSAKGKAPLTFQSATGTYTAFILDAEETLFAVVLMRLRPRNPPKIAPAANVPLVRLRVA